MLGHLKSHQGVFNPEEVSILTTVFDEAWKTVQDGAGASALNGEAQAMRESIARSSLPWLCSANATQAGCGRRPYAISRKTATKPGRIGE
jgi:hypothetical protein